MVVNFKGRGISQGARNLSRTLTLIKKNRMNERKINVSSKI
jgi:hypothetical protein